MHWSHISSVINNRLICTHVCALKYLCVKDAFIYLCFLFISFTKRSLQQCCMMYTNCIYKWGGLFVSGTSVALIRISRQYLPHTYFIYGPGHETVAVLLPGFAVNWQQNQVTRQPQFRDLTHMYIAFTVVDVK